MRQGPQNHHHNNKQRMRGRNRKGPNPLTRSYESNGGDVKIRGNALHIAEKYVQLARDAQSSGDRVAAENYFQHAEHYYRIVAAAQAQMPQPQPVFRSDDDGDDDDDRDNRQNGYSGEQQPIRQGGGQPAAYGGADEPQPYVNGNGGNGPDQPDAEAVTQPQADDNRGEGRDYRERNEYGGGGGGYRGRRRRPFRGYGDRGGHGAGEMQGQPDSAAEAAGDE